jgi:hypothetical protein
LKWWDGSESAGSLHCPPMAFFTSFFLYRPTKPPRVRPAELARFVEAVAETGVVAPGHKLPTELKFGAAIDHDDKDMAIRTRVGRGLYTIRDKPWDAREEPNSIGELAVLRRYDRPIYRAHLHLGGIEADLAAYMNSTEGFPEEPNLRLEDWSLTIEPIETHWLGSDHSYVVGWIKLGMSGYGYLYPLTPADLVRRAQTHPKLVALRELCRAIWPVTPGPVRVPLWWRLPHRRRRHAQDMRGGVPSRRVRKLRERMGDLWPYDSLERPFDWEWGIGETG